MAVRERIRRGADDIHLFDQPSYLGKWHNSESEPKRLGIGYDRVVPTVLTFDGLRVLVYPNDHRPAHVHVIGRGCEAVFNLNCPGGPIELRENYRFSHREIGHILDVLRGHLEESCRAWEHIHDIA